MRPHDVATIATQALAPSLEKLVPKDHGEEVAVFRSQVIGSLVHRKRTRGELKRALTTLSQKRGSGRRAATM